MTTRTPSQPIIYTRSFAILGQLLGYYRNPQSREKATNKSDQEIPAHRRDVASDTQLQHPHGNPIRPQQQRRTTPQGHLGGNKLSYL